MRLGQGKYYRPKPKVKADNTQQDLDNSGYHEKIEFNNNYCFIIH